MVGDANPPSDFFFNTLGYSAMSPITDVGLLEKLVRVINELKPEIVGLLGALIGAFIGFFASIIGALIGGRMTKKAALEAAEKAHNNNLILQEQAHRSSVEGRTQAIYDEINTLWERYMWGTGNALENLNDEEPITWYYPLTLNYFTIYEGNISLIGSLEDHELRKSIIISYTKAKSLIDSYRLNNEFVAKWENSQKQWKFTGSLSYAEDMRVMYSIMQDYGKKIKEIHKDIKHEFNNLKLLFNQRGIN